MPPETDINFLKFWFREKLIDSNCILDEIFRVVFSSQILEVEIKNSNSYSDAYNCQSQHLAELIDKICLNTPKLPKLQKN